MSSSGPLATVAGFWEVESKSLLLLRNHGFLTPENAAQRCEALHTALSSALDARYEAVATAAAQPPSSAEFVRIFREDAIRTFAGEQFREAEVATLYKVFAYVQDYHQGLGFIVAFLRLFLSEEDTVRVCCFLNDTACAGYFKLENEEYLHDAYVFDELVRDAPHVFTWPGSPDHPAATTLADLPAAAAKIATYTFSAQFLSKWFIGFCVHVFPFEAVVALFESVIRAPQKTTWYKFAAALLAATSEELARAKGTPEIIKVLKFDHELFADGLEIAQLRPAAFTAPLLDDEDAEAPGAPASGEDDDDESVDSTLREPTTNAYVWIVRFAEQLEVEGAALARADAEVRKRLEEQKRAREAAAAAASDEEDSFNFSDED